MLQSLEVHIALTFGKKKMQFSVLYNKGLYSLFYEKKFKWCLQSEEIIALFFHI